MAIGLNEKELYELLSFGAGEQEVRENLFGSLDDRAGRDEILAVVIARLIGKTADAVLENNKRISEQLIAAGLHLPG